MNMTHPDILETEALGYVRERKRPLPLNGPVHYRGEFNPAIAQRFLEARQARGLTCREVARQNGMTESLYGLIESGEIAPPYSTMRLAEFFGLAFYQ